MKFIPEIKEKIIQGVPNGESMREAILDSIDAWENGRAKVTPLDWGIFAVCDKIAKDIEGATK